MGTYRIMVVDDDSTSLETLGKFLQLEGYEVGTAETGAAALAMAGQCPPDLAVLDLRLPDISGLDLLDSLRRRYPAIEIIVVTGYASCRNTVQAMRLGAADVLEKPVYGDVLVEAVGRVIKSREPLTTGVEAHSASRWAQLVVRAVPTSRDPRTLLEWGRSIGVSEGALRNWCRTAGIPARRSLTFTRVLRAVVRTHETGLPAEQLLDIVDRRTLSKVLSLSGSEQGQLPKSPREFFERQTLVQDRLAIEAVAARLNDLTATV